jgi:putative phage-type endonuclease
LNPYDTKEDYIIKKCSAFYGEVVFKDNPFTLHGKKYEEVANRLYAKLYGTQVIEFGLISHGRLKWLAASPDGITKDGVMLEIKCPKSRKIDEAAIPLYYYIQVQIQLECCDLEECDFLECEIKEIETEEEFLNISLGEKQDLGIVLKLRDSGPDPKFIYPPAELQVAQDYITWKNKLLEEDSKNNLEPSYYMITKYNVIRIKRSKEWFANVRDDIKSTWEFIMKLQKSPEDFEKYKQSIYVLKNKDYIQRFNDTVCIIDDNSSFVLHGDKETDMDIDLELLGCEATNCMIESTE